MRATEFANAAEQARELGLTVGDTIQGREEVGDGWHEARITLLWIGTTHAAWVVSGRSSRPREGGAWSSPHEATNWDLGCREWERVETPPEHAALLPALGGGNSAMTLALSIRQPWASLIVLPETAYAPLDQQITPKDIENRTWETTVRGPILIHAAKSMTWDEYLDGLSFAYRISPSIVEALGVLTVEACVGRIADKNKRRITRIDLVHGLSDCPLPRGGIIGSANLADCVRRSSSPWFQGPYGFVLRNPKPLPFIPFKGQLGFFDVPEVLP